MIHFRSICFVLLLSASQAVSTPFVQRMACGNTVSDEYVREAEARFAQRKVASTNRTEIHNINVYWHIVLKDATTGNIPDAKIASQISVLNRDYRSAGVVWRLASTDRTMNASWFNISPDSPAQTAMKKALRKGNGPADLNVFTVGSITHPQVAGNILGYATFPWDYEAEPEDDGIVLDYRAAPDGALNGLNTGKILTHEAGHWTGLYHTFQGGCFGSGDEVADTPFERSASQGCPTGRDSCSQPGLDPIHNHMDYSDDACRTDFTAGQNARIQQALDIFR